MTKEQFKTFLESQEGSIESFERFTNDVATKNNFWNQPNNFLPDENLSAQVEQEALNWLQKAGFKTPNTTFHKNVNAYLLSLIIVKLTEFYLNNCDRLSDEADYTKNFPFRLWHNWADRRATKIMSQVVKNISEFNQSEIYLGCFVETDDSWGKDKIFAIVKGYELAQFLTYPFWSAKEKNLDVPATFFAWRSVHDTKRFFHHAFAFNIEKPPKNATLKLVPTRKTLNLTAKVVVQPVISEKGGPPNSSQTRRTIIKNTKICQKDEILTSFINWITQESFT